MDMDDAEFSRDIAKNVMQVFETWKAEAKKIEQQD